MENIYQFSKVYKNVPKSKQYYSRYDRRVIWDWPAQTHLEGDQLTHDYIKWRTCGMNASEPIRYPVGFKNRHKCLFSLKGDEIPEVKSLDYIESRKEIYLPLYTELVQKEKQFLELVERLKNGENLLIIEVDGPHEESLEYYRDKYDVPKDFIQNFTMLATRENIDIMLNDPKHPFGHGYCLALALLNY